MGSWRTRQQDRLLRLAANGVAWMAGQLRSKAREAAELAARKGIAADATGSADAQGKISAQGLRLGMYLVRRVAVASANDRTLVDPMLISVPAPVGDSLEYQVVADPKVEIEGVVPGPTDPGAPDSNGIFPWFDLPTTGDVQMLLVGLVALLGGSMIVGISQGDEIVCRLKTVIRALR